MIKWDQEIIDEFIRISRENIEEATHNILQLEKNNSDTELLHALFRKFHNLKGDAALCGFEKIARLSHVTETVLDKIREQTLKLNSQLIENLLLSIDALTALVDEAEGQATFGEHQLKTVIDNLSRYLPSDGRPNKGAEDQLLTPDAPLAVYLQVLGEVSRLFDQIVFLAMSGRFNGTLSDIQENTAGLSMSVENVFYPKASNLLNLFQDYTTVIRTHSIPFSEQNFGLLKDLFLIYIESLVAEITAMIGIRLITRTDLFRLDGAHAHHEHGGKELETSALYTIVDLRGNEDLDGDTKTRVEKTLKEVGQAYHIAAIIDPFKQVAAEHDIPVFASSLEALRDIIEVMEKGQ